MSPGLWLRPCTRADLELTFEITRDAMRGYVEQTWGRWSDIEQFDKHRQNFTPATHRLVLVKGEVAGLVAVETEPTHLWLVKLYLLAPFRGQGLGSAVLHQVVSDAHEEGKAVRLRVLRVNSGARRLYERHGFSVVEETPERFFMERPLDDTQAAAQQPAGLIGAPPAAERETGQAPSL